MHMQEKKTGIQFLKNLSILNQMEFLGLEHLYIKIEIIVLYSSVVMPQIRQQFILKNILKFKVISLRVLDQIMASSLLHFIWRP